MNHPYRRIKAACYINGTGMAVVTNITPLLLLTFRELYGISYSLLGFLVLVNFCTQLTIDLIGKAAGKSKAAEQVQPAEEPAPSLVLNLLDLF